MTAYFTDPMGEEFRKAIEAAINGDKKKKLPKRKNVDKALRDERTGKQPREPHKRNDALSKKKPRFTTKVARELR